MTFALEDRSLRWDGALILEGVSTELSAERGSHGAFLQFGAAQPSSRHRLSLGRVPALTRFVACHRFEPYWMKPTVGRRVREVPAETQFLLGQLGELGWLLVVPLVGEPLRFSLEAGRDDDLELLGETGCARLSGHTGPAVYIAVGEDPFAMMHACAAEVARRLGTGKLRRDKPPPDFIDQLGWCTWDAFYTEVSGAHVRLGLEAFAAGGITPKLLILDDGWLDVQRMATGETRLASFGANAKFDGGLRPFAEMVKVEFGIRTLLVWHTIVGYWGGVTEDLGYGAVDQFRHFGEGVLVHAPRCNNDWWGELVGFIPEHSVARFFDDYHRTLSEQGVDGVKVDSQAVLEALSQGQGGRVRVSRVYREALEASTTKYFAGRLLNCMSHAQETWYGATASSLARSSIDYFPTRPESHGLHVYSNALIGLWFGQFMHLDWDMFQSAHPMAAFHAAARAISGGPVYVSDRPGEHDFELLGKLVCSDGSVLLADEPALPTLDSLLLDPSREPGLFKIWNRNGRAAVVGAFNCTFAPGTPELLTGVVGPADVPGFAGDRFVAYAHCARTFSVVDGAERWSVALGPGGFEIYTLVPIDEDFAAIGLVDMFNSRAAVSDELRRGHESCTMTLRDGGRFVAYSARAPRVLRVDQRSVPFTFDAARGRLDTSVDRRGRSQVVIEW